MTLLSEYWGWFGGIKIIDTINKRDEIRNISGYEKDVSNGAVYGTLSRLKGKKFLSKVIVLDDDDEVLAYQLTGTGHTAINAIREKARKAIVAIPVAGG